MARSYIYTTALPAFILSANTIQLENLKQAEQQREALFDNIIFFNKLCLEQNVILDSYDISPIRSIIINNNLLAINIQKKLLIKSIHVGCFRYPTVPRNTSTIRFTIHSNNTHTQIKTAINIIASEINNAQL
jgi:8-amino-7-oxononanoate synthase